MTLAQINPEPELLPARADTDSWVTVVREVTILAQQIAGTTFVPKGLRDSIPATAAAILYGREVGLPPMTALSQIAVVDGRPGLSAEAMRALVFAAGHEIVIDEATTSVCRIRGRRSRSETWTPVEWTLDQARRAGLLRRGSAWEFYPADMLVARATTALCRRIFPDVIHGFRSTEELDDMGGGSSIPPPAQSPPTRTVRRTRKTAAPQPVDAEPTDAPSKPEPEATEDDTSATVPEDTGPQEPESSGTPKPKPKPRRSPRRTASLPDEGSPGEASSSDPIPPPPPDDQLPIQIPTIDVKPEPEPEERPINSVTRKIIMMQLRRLGLDDDTIGRPRRLDLLKSIAGRDRLDTSADLKQTEGSAIATVLSTARDAQALDELLAVATVSEIADKIGEEDKE